MKKLLSNISDFVVTKWYITNTDLKKDGMFELEECPYGTGYGYYILSLKMTIDLASLCQSGGIDIEELDECELILECRDSGVKECDIIDSKMQFLGTYQKKGNSYTIPLSIFKTANKFTDTVSFFYISNDRATTTDNILNVSAEI